MSKALKIQQDWEGEKNEAIILGLETKVERLREMNNDKDAKIQSLSESLTKTQKREKMQNERKINACKKLKDKNEEIQWLKAESKKEKGNHENKISHLQLSIETLRNRGGLTTQAA